MKIVIAGGVAAGTKVAAKLKRECPQAEIVIYTKGEDISYAGCGLPYYVGGAIASREDLIVNSPQKFMGLTGTQVYPGHEVVKLDASGKTVVVRGQREETVAYDKLILAVGAEPVIPPVKGCDLPGVFTMRTPDDAIGVRAYADHHHCRQAVVVGGGFIGLEVAENLMARGLKVTVMDMADQLMPNIFDREMAHYVRRKLQAKGISVLTETALSGVAGQEQVTGVETSTGTIPADLVVLAIGVRPATRFLEGSGLEMERGCIVTDGFQRTNLADVYAVGDCALVKNRITGKKQWSAMGSTANIAGRCLALNLSGHSWEYPGCLGTGVVKLAEDLCAARTGLTEVQARDMGYDVITALCVTDDKAHYYPGASIFITKLIADRSTHKLLGMQTLGAGAVDKMADVAVVGLSMGACVEDFITMDFAYAPPFSTAIHPFAAACSILINKLEGRLESVTPTEYTAGAAKDYRVLDAHPAPTIAGAQWVDLANLGALVDQLDREEKLLLVCARGKRGYLIQNKLRAMGYTNTRVLEGGATFNEV